MKIVCGVDIIRPKGFKHTRPLSTKPAAVLPPRVVLCDRELPGWRLKEKTVIRDARAE